MSDDWLSKLQKGDKVIVSKWFSPEFVTVVERTTKTQVLLEGTSSRFRKSHGNLVGGSTYSGACLLEWTEEKEEVIKAKARRSNMLSYIDKRNFSSLTDKELSTIYNLLKSYEKGNTNEPT